MDVETYLPLSIIGNLTGIWGLIQTINFHKLEYIGKPFALMFPLTLKRFFHLNRLMPYSPKNMKFYS